MLYEVITLMYSYSASRFDIYIKTLIPSCIPYFFTGLKISAPMAITASILVDTLQGDGGLGCMLSQSLKHAMSIYVVITSYSIHYTKLYDYYIRNESIIRPVTSSNYIPCPDA